MRCARTDGRTDRGRHHTCDASCLSPRLSVGDWEAGMDAAPCDPRGTHSDLSLAAAPPSNILGSRRGRGSGNVIHHCPTQVAVGRRCCPKLYYERRSSCTVAAPPFFPSFDAAAAAGDKKALRSIYVAVVACCVPAVACHRLTNKRAHLPQCPARR